MKSLPVFLLLLVLSLRALSQDNVGDLLVQAAGYESAKKSEDALKTYIQVLTLQPVNLTALCKSSELCSVVGNHQLNKATRLKYFEAARKYATIALKVDSTWSEANLVMGLAMGRAALIESGKARIAAVNDIKSYAEKAIVYDPSNYKAYHLLGRWCFEVSKLGFFERTAAKMLFGGIPKSSFAEAIGYYEKSRAIAPGFALNYLECAKAYEKNDQIPQAIALLQQLQTMPQVTEDDAEVQKEGKALLASLRK